jgi:hypothetical protein
VRGLSPLTSCLGADPAWWLGRSSKPRWRRLRWLRWVRFPHAPATLSLATLLFSSALGAARVSAQDSTRAGPDTSARALPDTGLAADTTRQAAADTTAAAPASDSLGHRASKPAAALWRSLVLPGWGQVRLGRKLTAGLFIAAEGTLLGLSLKANADLHYLRRIGADTATIDAKSQDREDWLVLLAVNHLLSGLEAFIAANLSDFPGELKLERVPHGVGASVRVPVRFP